MNTLQLAIENAQAYLLYQGWRYSPETGAWRHPKRGEFFNIWRAMAAEEEG